MITDLDVARTASGVVAHLAGYNATTSARSLTELTRSAGSIRICP